MPWFLNKIDQSGAEADVRVHIRAWIVAVERKESIRRVVPVAPAIHQTPRFPGTSPTVRSCCAVYPSTEDATDFCQHRSPFSVSSWTDQLIFWLHGQVNEASEHLELVVNLFLIWSFAFMCSISQNTPPEHHPL